MHQQQTLKLKGKRVRFYSKVDLINELEKEKREGRAGRIALALLRMDLLILDELAEPGVTQCKCLQACCIGQWRQRPPGIGNSGDQDRDVHCS